MCSSDLAERTLAGEECAALIAVAGGTARAGVLDLCYQLRKNARLFHLPALVLADADLAATPVEAYAQGASLVLPRAMDSDQLTAEIAALLQRQFRRRVLRDRLMNVIPLSSLDPETGLATDAFIADRKSTRLNSSH